MKNTSKRTLLLIIMLVVVLSVSAYATKMDIVKSEIIFHDGSKLSFATKSNKSAEEILKENNIILLDDEVVKESNEGDKKIIYIDKKNSNENIVKSENFKEVSSEVIRNDNSSIIEKIEIETIEIPFNTITKESKNQDNTRSMVIQIGENGIKEIKYKSIYKNQELIDRKILEEKEVEKSFKNSRLRNIYNSLEIMRILENENDLEKAVAVFNSQKNNMVLTRNIKNIMYDFSRDGKEFCKKVY